MIRSLLQRKKLILRLTVWPMVLASVALVLSFLFLLQTKELAIDEVSLTPQALPFPVGVDPTNQTIEEKPNIDFYYSHLFAANDTRTVTFLRDVQRVFLTEDWYQNLASAGTKVLVIYAGQRKEEVVDAFGDILRWDDNERAVFTDLVIGDQDILAEGLFFPGSYVVPNDASPEFVATLLLTRFNQNITDRYSGEVAAQVPLEQALIIASLIEREATTFEDMRIVSGVIWNRLFIDMKLQLDATLQYAKGSNPYEPTWWPVPRPADKYIDSPYNTYQNEGLPPAPIANPSGKALLAALNPISSDCLFYFHDDYGRLHCSVDYGGHVEKLREQYGRGQ